MESVADTSKGSRYLIRNNVLKIAYKMWKERENEKESFEKIKDFRNFLFALPVPISVRRKYVRPGVSCANADPIQPLINRANYSFTAL
jgi:hypothetical protein